MRREPYGVLKGRVVEVRAESNGHSPHFQALVQAGDYQFRLAINVRSVKGQQHHRDLLVGLRRDWEHPLTRRLPDLPHGFTQIDGPESGVALDYMRGHLITRDEMVKVPAYEPGDNNDLVDFLDLLFGIAVNDPQVEVYIWGMRWGPEPHHPDDIFGFDPGDGIHNIHMNQGSTGKHAVENAPWQDGGMVGHRPDLDRWLAIFLAFQTQCWETDSHGEPCNPPRH